MTRRFRLWDAPRLHRAHLSPKPLELEAVVLEGGSPVSHAVRSAVQPGQRVVTLVLPDAAGHGIAGYVQARRRTDPAEADVTWLAPDAADGAALHWSRLVAALTQALGGAGVERVFAAPAIDDAVAGHVFRQLGFAEGCVDSVYRCAVPAAEPAADRRVVDESPALTLRIELALMNQLPPTLRAAQGTTDWRSYPAGGWGHQGARRRVWLDGRGEVLGAWQALAGPRGIWLRLVLGDGADATTLVRLATGDAVAEFGSERPFYTSVRPHEGGLAVALEAAGYDLVARRRRLVKHTTVRVLAPQWRSNRLAEAVHDPAASRGASAQDAINTAGNARPRSLS